MKVIKGKTDPHREVVFGTHTGNDNGGPADNDNTVTGLVEVPDPLSGDNPTYTLAAVSTPASISVHQSASVFLIEGRLTASSVTNSVLL